MNSSTLLKIMLPISLLSGFSCQNEVTNQTNSSGDIFKLPGLEKFGKVRLNERNFDRVRNLHVNWYAAGIKAVMGKMGRDLFVQLTKEEQRKLANCLDRIEDKKDLVLAANCLINARKLFLMRIGTETVENDRKEGIRSVQKRVWLDNVEVGTLKSGEGRRSGDEAKNTEEKQPKKEEGNLRRIRLGTNRASSNLYTNPGSNSSLAGSNSTTIGRRSKRRVNSAVPQEWAEWAKRLRRFRANAKVGEKHLTGKEKKPKGMGSKWTIDRDDLRPKFEIKQKDSLEKLPSQQDRSAISRVSNLISMMVGKNASSDESNGGKVQWTQMYESLVRLKRANDERKEAPGARVYEMRMYDLVLDRKEPSLGPKEKMSPRGLLQMGLSLLNKLHNESAQRDSNFKWMSPRLAPLMPDKQGASKSVLSPSVFALYEVDVDEKGGKGRRPEGVPDIASMPEVLRATGLNKQDRDALLQSLMEISGSIGHVQEAMDLLKALNFFEIEPDLADANGRVLNSYTKMEKAFEKEQEREIEQEGWTFLRRRQFDQLCQDQKADFPGELGEEIESFGSLDRKGRELAIWKRIERIARNIPDEIGDKLDRRKGEKLLRLHSDRRRRRRRQAPEIQWLSVLKPITMAPFMFSPQFGLSVLGPLILSPNLFSPLILAPSVLGPYVLSPGAPIPFILSPYVFGPFILSPMAMAPFILTPYVLSPNILNPYAMAPLILSPNVLSPDILSPQVLGGGVLSPTVGSPAVLTETFLMASVLSPSVLSK